MLIITLYEVKQAKGANLNLGDMKRKIDEQGESCFFFSFFNTILFGNDD